MNARLSSRERNTVSSVWQERFVPLLRSGEGAGEQGRQTWCDCAHPPMVSVID